MGYSVKDRAERVGNFRWLSVQAMELLARWIPTTAEMEAKVLFGRHVWEFAQHADALGKRVFELRAPLNDERPDEGMRATLDRIAASEGGAARVVSFYDELCPAIVRAYQDYLDATDTLMDEPTVRILERAQADLQRMAHERARLPAAVRGREAA